MDWLFHIVFTCFKSRHLKKKKKKRTFKTPCVNVSLDILVADWDKVHLIYPNKVLCAQSRIIILPPRFIAVHLFLNKEPQYCSKDNTRKNRLNKLFIWVFNELRHTRLNIFRLENILL